MCHLLAKVGPVIFEDFSFSEVSNCQMGLFYFKRSLGKLKLSVDHKSNNYVLFRKYLMFVKPISAEVIHFFGLSLLTFGTFAKR